MTCRFLMLSGKAHVDETQSIWMVNDHTVRIPEEELEYLCSVDLKLRDENSPLKSVLVDLDHTVKIDDDYYIQSTDDRKKHWLNCLEQFHDWILQADRPIWGKLPNPPELDYGNEEYARMIAAIIQILEESIRLEEPIDHWLGKS